MTETVRVETADPTTSTEATTSTTQECPPFTLGTTSFSDIVVTEVDCETARDLLDRTTLSSVRRNRNEWNYAGWTWTLEPVNELSVTVEGRNDPARIRAVLATL